MTSLTFDGLPDLPQIETLRSVASQLWQREEVIAVWLGGSFARGVADDYSDLDLRVAVAGDAADYSFSDLSASGLSALIGEQIVGGLSLHWDRTVLHQIVLAGGVIMDLLIQSVSKEPPQDYTHVLGCRDAAFGELLTQAHLPPTEDPTPADPAAIRQAVTDFWIGSHKHAKILHRNLDLLLLIGLGLEQSVLIRLWSVDATGNGPSPQRETIHTLTPIVRAVMGSLGTRCLETLGAARTNRAEIIRAIETNREEAARVGRRLAQQLGFEYPEALEQTVRTAWQSYLAESSGEHT